MGQSRPLFVYFRSFLITISIQIEKKHRWCAWDLSLGPQDGSHRRNHGAMVASPKLANFAEAKFLPNQQFTKYTE